MSYLANVFKVMIASPSDVSEERALIREVINEWNAVHSEDKRIILMPIGWETHASPAFGRPQEVINNQILQDADLLVAVFWTRIGSPTGKAISGTIEEIDKHTNAGKPAMIYISEAKVNRHELNPKQTKALDKYIKKTRNDALTESYESTLELREKFSRQLALTVLRYFKREMTFEIVETSTTTNSLSDSAKRLLLEASKDYKGIIFNTSSFGGRSINTNDIEFIQERNPRTEAYWLKVLDELIDAELIKDEGYKKEVLKITQNGYDLADSLGLKENISGAE
ncbi:hypothetical protein GCM10027347_17370 [Larkinella harenae]